jgi:hypothetical protein
MHMLHLFFLLADYQIEFSAMIDSDGFGARLVFSFVGSSTAGLAFTTWFHASMCQGHVACMTCSLQAFQQYTGPWTVSVPAWLCVAAEHTPVTRISYWHLQWVLEGNAAWMQCSASVCPHDAS